MRRIALVLAAALCCGGCLVVNLHPAYDDESIGWEPALLGSWANVEDNAALEIERSEWRSYRIAYTYPIESGTLTGYLTSVADERYLDLMPVRGEDRGSFVVPVHVVLRVRLDGDTLELTPLSHGWFYDRLERARPIPGLEAVQDQKQNAIVVSPTARFRAWLRGRDRREPAFGTPAVFTRKRPGAR